MRKILVLSILLVTGCAEIEMSIPNARLESPEAMQEHFSLGVQGSIEPVQNIKLTDDASVRPPTSPGGAAYGYPRVERRNGIFGKAFFGLPQKIEISLKTGMSSSPLVLGGKIQVIGDVAEKAKKGNFSLAPVINYASTTRGKSGNQDGTFGRGGYPWNGTITADYFDVGLVAGYRFADEWLVFGGPFYTKYKITGKVDQTASDDGRSAGGKYSFEGFGTHTGIHVDIGYSSKGQMAIFLEGTLTRVTFTTMEDKTELSPGVSLVGVVPIF